MEVRKLTWMIWEIRNQLSQFTRSFVFAELQVFKYSAYNLSHQEQCL